MAKGLGPVRSRSARLRAPSDGRWIGNFDLKFCFRKKNDQLKLSNIKWTKNEQKWVKSQQEWLKYKEDNRKSNEELTKKYEDKIKEIGELRAKYDAEKIATAALQKSNDSEEYLKLKKENETLKNKYNNRTKSARNQIDKLAKLFLE